MVQILWRLLLIILIAIGVSLGYCAEIANMSKPDFIRFLSENDISIFNFENENELSEDIANA